MADVVKMRSPEGEVKEVPAEPAKLTPYMVAGWVQVLEPETKKEAKN